MLSHEQYNLLCHIDETGHMLLTTSKDEEVELWRKRYITLVVGDSKVKFILTIAAYREIRCYERRYKSSLKKE